MEDRALFIVMLIETAILGGILLLYPRIARKGLLFGVYIGEGASEGEPARGITRSWYRGMITSIVVCLAIGILLVVTTTKPVAAIAPIFLLMAAFLVFYLQAYFRARALAPAGPPPLAVAPAVAVPATSPLLPAVTLFLGVACGVIAILYTWMHYPELPAQVPTHFGPSGRPDHWKVKSFSTVMLLPLMVLVMGTLMGGIAWLTAHAKRGLRRSDEGSSLEAQMRFRTAMTRYLCGLAILMISMLTFMSIQSVRVALGAAEGLGSLVLVLGIGMAVCAIGGVLYLALRYGQGGSRIERARADTPLTDGLADNLHWILGTFYINREDPSFLVERRFGFGYTLNFGNWKAVALLAGFLTIVLAVVVTAIATG